MYDVLTSPAGEVELLSEFMAYTIDFKGGVFVAGGFVTNNRDSENFRYADIITGAGPDGGPHVRVLRLLDGDVIPWTYNEAAGFFPYSPGFLGGVSLSTFDLNGDGQDDIITGAGPTGGPHVRTFAGQSVNDFQTFSPVPLFENFAFGIDDTEGLSIG
jgi:hypothetical protein